MGWEGKIKCGNCCYIKKWNMFDDKVCYFIMIVNVCRECFNNKNIWEIMKKLSGLFKRYFYYKIVWFVIYNII